MAPVRHRAIAPDGGRHADDDASAAAPAETSSSSAEEVANDLDGIDASIAHAETEDKIYSGGLIKSLIGTELHTLRQTRALLQQRASAWKYGIRLTYTCDGSPFRPPADAAAQLASVEEDIASTRDKLAAAQAEADKYSGGLVRAMSLTAVATMRNTLAMLEQRRVALKYGLPQFIGFQARGAEPSVASDADASAPPSNPDPDALRTRASNERPWRIVSVDARVTESNDMWWRYAWKLTLENDDDQPHVFDATIEFQDADGFVIDTDDSNDLIVGARSEETFTGSALVSTPGASKVAKTNAKVQIQ